MTSCVEVYRLATWRAETHGQADDCQRITAVRYTADILALSQDSLSLRLNLRSEQVDLTHGGGAGAVRLSRPAPLGDLSRAR